MNEQDKEDDKNKTLLDDYDPNDDLEDNEIEEQDVDEFKDKSCCSKCCFYLCCCCCCHSREKGKGFYQKGWRNYLVKEGNESSDVPFRILTNLFFNKYLLSSFVLLFVFMLFLLLIFCSSFSLTLLYSFSE